MKNEKNWNHLQTYIERDIRRLNSRLTIGETSSDNGVMESNPYRGVRLASDESMLPQSERGFALMNPLMILVKIIKLRWIHILSYDQ
ncbi:fimbria/pilus outer membrane usher protein, partial [Providencia huaxiensis]|uniref:fimbria/pilus outer membrane usher protein n=1 Tax=Providencia huaxiensis TaxID=2027290 RepID=UPI0034E608B0